MAKIKNVIYIHTHDMGRYISPYGHTMPTPNLESFAQEATLFRQAFCCAPTCSPSRAGLLTGTTPHESGMLGLAHRGFIFTHPEHHLAAYLKKQGYLTALCGIQHEFNCAWDQMPYEYVMKEQSSEGHIENDRMWTEAACDFLKTKHDRPFFLSYGLFYPHRDFAAADYEIYRPEEVQLPDHLPDTPEIRCDMADYQYSVQLADACIGRVLDTIRENGHAEDSLVIVTTDHGIAFPQMKCNLTDLGIGVSLMLSYPGNPSVGKSTDALVSHLDVYPTVCDLLGVPRPDHLEGKSLCPLLENHLTEVRDSIFAEVSFHAGYEPMRCIRTQQFKLIRRFYFGGPVLSNCDDSPTKTTLVKDGWGGSMLPEFELYDLQLDPAESCNRSGFAEYRGIRDNLELRLHEWMQATNDPLLDGIIPPPPGAIINSPESTSPTSGPFETVT